MIFLNDIQNPHPLRDAGLFLYDYNNNAISISRGWNSCYTLLTGNFLRNLIDFFIFHRLRQREHHSNKNGWRHRANLISSRPTRRNISQSCYRENRSSMAAGSILGTTCNIGIDNQAKIIRSIGFNDIGTPEYHGAYIVQQSVWWVLYHERLWLFRHETRHVCFLLSVFLLFRR